MGCVQGHVTYLNLGKCDSISETVQDEDSCNGRLIGNYVWPTNDLE